MLTKNLIINKTKNYRLNQTMEKINFKKVQEWNSIGKASIQQ